MKRKDILYLGVVAFVAAIITYFMAGLVFSAQQKRTATVPIVGSIDSNFPDIKNNPSYKSIFNDKALNPTQSIQIGNGQNTAPFNTSR